MGAGDQLFQHLALGQAVVVRQSFERKIGDEAHFDLKGSANPVAVLGLMLCVGLGYDEPPRYCVTTRMINWPDSVIASILWPAVKAIELNN